MMAGLRTHVVASETGESPFSVRLAMGNHTVRGDEPVAAGGGDLGPNPFEMLAAALAECTAMTVRWFANNEGWPVDHIEVVVDHAKRAIEGASAPVDCFEKTILISGPDVTEEQRARLFELASRCPVQRVLEGNPLISAKLAVDQSIGDRERRSA